MRGLVRLTFAALLCLALAPAAAYAQASIAGVVKDTSGAVLPGVTVEASSPALIEKSRSVVTDGAGQYRIVDLKPGTYAVTFTLTGFNTVKRDGIELTGSFTATVNADMRVGAVAETITVTGETPLVDVQSSAVQKVVTKEVIDAIPTGRLGINLAALQPGMILGAATGTGALSANANSLNIQDVGGAAGDTFTDLSIHGGKASEQRQTIAGLSAATIIRFGESLSSSPSFTAMQEMSVDTSGADASLATGGVRMNYIPRDGGNTFRGLMFFSGANGSMQASNYSTGTVDPSTGACSPADSLQCRGLRTQPGALKEVFDVNPGFGGPIMKDKLWFFASARWTQAENYVPQDYPNKNFVVGQTPTNLFNNQTLTYSPDLTKPLLTTYGGGGRFREQTARLSWQINQKNKLGVYYNNKWRRYRNGSTTVADEATNNTYFFPFSDQLVQWSSPVTNKLLLEAGVWHHQETWGGSMAGFDQVDPLAIGVSDAAPFSNVPGYVQLINSFHGRVGPAYSPSHNPNTRGNFAVSYITGAHAFKTGFDLANADRKFWNGSVVPYSYIVSTVTPGKLGIPVPTGLMLRSDGCMDPLARMVNGKLTTPTTSYTDPLNCPTFQENKLDLESGVFAQDRWTMSRVTLSLGIRFDGFKASQPAYHLYPSLLTPNRNFDVPEFQTVDHKDWTPKMAASWDVFGDGKTALKVNFSKYVLGQSLFASNPLVTLSNSNIVTTAGGTVPFINAGRTWTDVNGNFIPDCDLTNPNAQGPTASGANRQVDTCGAVVGNNLRMYDTAPFPQATGDPDARYGWGKRPYSWEFSLSAQREISRGVSVYGGYFRRWFGNFLVTDDLLHSATDYDPFGITPGLIPPAPPSAGGATLPSNIVTSGFYNQKPTSAPGASNFTGLTDTFFPGSNVIDHWNGFDIALNLRLPRGIIFQGGTSTGRQVTDNCDIVDPANAGKFGTRSPLVELLATTGTSLNACHVVQAWLTQAKFLGSYTVPKVDVQIGASFQSIPGIELAANYAAPNSDIARPVSQGGLGRLPNGAVSAAATTTLAIIPPESTYYTRLNQLDLRFGKILRYGGRRANISLDLFNLFNQDTITGAGFSYSAANGWLAPTSVIAPRLTKVSVTFDF